MKLGPVERAIVRLFWREKLNTAQIARKMEMPEHKVDRIIAREMDRRAKR